MARPIYFKLKLGECPEGSRIRLVGRYGPRPGVWTVVGVGVVVSTLRLKCGYTRQVPHDLEVSVVELADRVKDKEAA